jgi:hypothetical protein
MKEEGELWWESENKNKARFCFSESLGSAPPESTSLLLPLHYFLLPAELSRPTKPLV